MGTIDGRLGRLILLPLSVLFLSACPASAGESEESREQEPESAPSPAQEAASADGAEELRFSQAGGEITWVGSRIIGGRHDGGFREFEGKITVSGGRAETSSLEFTINLQSIWSDNERLTAHLKNDDFFDVDNHPTGTFVSTSVVEGGEGDATHTITGNLTLRGTTRSVTFPAKIEVSDQTLRAQGEFELDRMQFGIAFRGPADNLIRDKAKVSFSITAPRS